MNEETALALNALNRTFYRDHARSFEETRGDPWPGWRRILPHLAQAGCPSFLSVLDIGCGNARFARFLSDALTRPLVYRGIDASASLLAAARGKSIPRVAAEFEQRDLVEEPLPAAGTSETYDCVAAFGILHHIPGTARRRELLERLAQRVAPRGLLALAFWDFGAHARFAGKQVGVPEYNRHSPWPIDPRQLEPGDTLLRWGDRGSGPIRYCHWVDPAEERDLLAHIDLEPLDSYASDGRGGALNRYRLLRNAPLARQPGLRSQLEPEGGL